MAVVAAGLPPLLPTPPSCVGLRPGARSYASWRFEPTEKPAGRASLSRNWNDDKAAGVGVPSASGEAKMPGRASRSKNWNDDKEHGRGGKRAASRAPSADRTEKKNKLLAMEVAIKNDKQEASAIVVETEAAPAPEPEKLYAGPSFSVSPRPIDLPIPWVLILPRYACAQD